MQIIKDGIDQGALMALQDAGGGCTNISAISRAAPSLSLGSCPAPRVQIPAFGALLRAGQMELSRLGNSEHHKPSGSVFLNWDHSLIQFTAQPWSYREGEEPREGEQEGAGMNSDASA